MRYEQALRSTLGEQPCPVLVEVDVRHRPPHMVLINGAVAKLRWSRRTGGSVRQVLR